MLKTKYVEMDTYTASRLQKAVLQQYSNTDTRILTSMLTQEQLSARTDCQPIRAGLFQATRLPLGARAAAVGHERRGDPLFGSTAIFVRLANFLRLEYLVSNNI